MKPYFTRFRHLPLSCLLAFLLLSGCGMNASGEHTVSMDQDWFKNEINGRTIEYKNWVIKIGEKEIPIEKKKSGFYQMLEFDMPGEGIRNLEIEMKRDERVMRFLSVALDKYAKEYAEKRKGKLKSKS